MYVAVQLVANIEDSNFLLHKRNLTYVYLTVISPTEIEKTMTEIAQVKTLGKLSIHHQGQFG